MIPLTQLTPVLLHYPEFIEQFDLPATQADLDLLNKPLLAPTQYFALITPPSNFKNLGIPYQPKAYNISLNPNFLGGLRVNLHPTIGNGIGEAYKVEYYSWTQSLSPSDRFTGRTRGYKDLVYTEHWRIPSLERKYFIFPYELDTYKIPLATETISLLTGDTVKELDLTNYPQVLSIESIKLVDGTKLNWTVKDNSYKWQPLYYSNLDNNFNMKLDLSSNSGLSLGNRVVVNYYDPIITRLDLSIRSVKPYLSWTAPRSNVVI